MKKLGRIGSLIVTDRIFPIYNVASTKFYRYQRSIQRCSDVLITYNLSDRRFEDDQIKYLVYKVLAVWW